MPPIEIRDSAAGGELYGMWNIIFSPLSVCPSRFTHVGNRKIIFIMLNIASNQHDNRMAVYEEETWIEQIKAFIILARG